MTIRKFHTAYKAIICALLVIGYALYRFLYPEQIVACINDAYQDATLSWNRNFVVDPTQPAYEGNNHNQLTVTGKAMIGTGQVSMDLWIAILGLVWYNAYY